MRINKSFERRVFYIFAIFSLIISLLFVALSIFSAYFVEDEILEKILANEAQYLELKYQSEQVIVQPRVDYMQLYLDIADAPAEVVSAYQANPYLTEVFSQRDNRHYHVQFLFLGGKYNPILIADVGAFLTVSRVSKQLMFLFVSGFVIALLIALILAYYIAGKTTQPILNLTREVIRQQTESDDISLDLFNSQDEIAYLANTINHTLQQLNEALQRERDFTRDVSHELRTPLTILNNLIALAETRTLEKTDLKQLKDATGQMNNIVSTLLAIARAESVTVEACLLRPIIEECILAVHHLITVKDFVIKLDVDDNSKIVGHRLLIRLLVHNLIENAINYSAEPELLISFDGEWLMFSNRYGLSEPPLLSADIVNPSVKQPDSLGLGQGLYLVKRISHALNWQYELTYKQQLFNFSLRVK